MCFFDVLGCGFASALQASADVDVTEVPILASCMKLYV